MTNTFLQGELPAVHTTFVGRRDELAAVRQSIGVSPLTTLTGIGGVGKTRLAFEAARLSRKTFSNGVRFVDLAPLRDPGLVAQAVAAALGMRTDSTWSLSALGDYRYRHSRVETHRWADGGWLEPEAMIEFLGAFPADDRSGDVYAIRTDRLNAAT